MSNIDSYKRALIETIAEKYPKHSVKQIFDKIKSPKNPYLVESDILPFAEEAHVPADQLQCIFAPFNVRNMLIGPKQWANFFESGFYTGSKSEKCRDDMSETELRILRIFVNAVKIRTKSSPSERWTQMMMRNPPALGQAKLRVATLCKFADELGLPFAPESLVDSLFSFMKEKTEALSFEQFQGLMSTFS